MLTPEEIEEISRDKAEEFEGHHRLNPAKLSRWIRQFPPEQHALAAKILNNVRYITPGAFTGMARGMVAAISELVGTDGPQLAFMPAKGEGSGAQILARTLRSVRNVDRGRWQLLEIFDLHTNGPGQAEHLCIFDDFLGTGNTIKEFWENVEPLIRPHGLNVILGSLVVNPGARSVVDEHFPVSTFVQELPRSDNIFDETHRAFTTEEVSQIDVLCGRLSVRQALKRGFGQSGLLLSFYYGCPNNTLPILWFDRDTNGWEPVFTRTATG